MGPNRFALGCWDKDDALGCTPEMPPPVLGNAFTDKLKSIPPKGWLAIGGAALLILLIAKRRTVATAAQSVAERAKEAAQSLVGAFLTLNAIRKAMPNVSLAKATSLLPDLTLALDEANINTPKRVAAFLAQVGHESGDFRYMEELASGAAYEGRKDLGNTQPGDGKRFKGRGPIQLTGRSNYRAFTNAIGKKYGVDFEKNPELVADPRWGFKAASWFWNSKNLNSYADRGDFNSITYRINGGYNGKADRDKRYAIASAALMPVGNA
jgi:predicted chitinase